MNSGAVEEGGKVAGSLIEAMKTQPMTLALVVFNIVFIFAVLYAGNAQRAILDKVITQQSETAKLLYNCIPNTERTLRQ
jgi:hypothetical protein